MRDAAAWYDQQREGEGLRFVLQVIHLFERIAESPLQFPQIEAGLRRGLLNRYPFGAYFEVSDFEVVIHAVLHLRRRPEFWKQRMS